MPAGRCSRVQLTTKTDLGKSLLEYTFYTADVFTNRSFQGAQIAVFPEAKGLNTHAMQQLANELNLSETVFVFNSDGEADGRTMRTFSPLGEIDFAGHPIIATAFVLARTGDVVLDAPSTMIRLKQNTGPVAINIIARDGQPELVQFSLRPEPVIDRFVPREIEIAEFLNIPVGSIDNKKYQPMMVSCGFPYLVVPLTSYRAVRDARFDLSIWGQTTAPATSAQEILLFSNQTANSAAKFHARLVGPRIGVGEDPPIGSSIPAFTSYLCAQSNARRGSYRFAVDRGTEETRLSLLHIEIDNKGGNQLTVRVGGQAVMVSKGTINAPVSD
jgi:trans-2,3-dihydro-3-hydroxyanthranilate isomerase